MRKYSTRGLMLSDLPLPIDKRTTGFYSVMKISNSKILHLYFQVPTSPYSGKRLTKLNGHIEFCNVSFSYPARKHVQVRPTLGQNFMNKACYVIPPGSQWHKSHS